MTARVRFGGRAKGVPNKATIAREKAIRESGLTPLDYMIQIMRDTTQPIVRRLEAARFAAPYVHPKLATIEHVGKGGGPIETANVSEFELARRIAFLLDPPRARLN